MIVGGLAWVAMMFSVGCESMPWEDSGESESAEAGDEGPCEEYAAKICSESGEQSPTCGSMKTAAGLMPPESCEAALAKVDYSLEQLSAERAKCDELVEKLCADLGEDTDSCGMVKEQTGQFPTERCEMMLGHYDEVLADLKKREAMNEPLSPDKAKEMAAGDLPAFGPKDAEVTIVEFSDFQCPYCSRAAEVAEKVRDEYGDEVRFVFRQYPLPMHPQARDAAKAALAANAQGKFWEYHDKLFENQKKLDSESLQKYASEVGLDEDQFQKALEEDEAAEQIDADMKIGQEVNVSGTPTMFLNGERVANPTDFEVVSEMIEKELKG